MVKIDFILLTFLESIIVDATQLIAGVAYFPILYQYEIHQYFLDLSSGVTQAVKPSIVRFPLHIVSVSLLYRFEGFKQPLFETGEKYKSKYEANIRRNRDNGAIHLKLGATCFHEEQNDNYTSQVRTEDSTIFLNLDLCP